MIGLDETLDAVCKKEDLSDFLSGSDITNCEDAEYKHATAFLEKIDETLRRSQASDTLVLGYLDLASLLNTRVSQLFSKELCCGDEALTIKHSYM